jgi:signal transduction histidine kinase
MTSSTVPTPPAGEDIDSLVEDLLRIKTFQDLPEGDVRWIASQMTVTSFEVGDILFREGDPVTQLLVALSGEYVARPEKGPDTGRRFFIRAGDVSGLLPYSRLKTAGSTARAVQAGRTATLPATLFPELQRRVPEFYARLVNRMTDRVRDTARDALQLEKMAALGKLSAGLAHELNNPAAAARRAAENLKGCVQKARDANLRLDERALSTEQRVFLTRIEQAWGVDRSAAPSNSLERADLEDEIGSWLDQRNVPQSWELASGLADAACDLATLNELAERFDPDALVDVLERVTASFTISRLISEIESSTSRISELVKAVKEYSYMDQMPQQEIDVHEGIENTLIMLASRLKSGIVVNREYDKSIPKIPAYGSELNQVWTNLIDNASDAMDGKGQIWIRTARELNWVLVEVRDSGPGIPEDVKGRVFEPFFTTKPVGQGTGLGLDTVYRIVRKHSGEILLESKPGDTRFQIRLPIAKPSIGETK